MLLGRVLINRGARIRRFDVRYAPDSGAKADIGGIPDGYRLNATHRRRFLFSGLLRCAVCAGAYCIIGHDRYGCANRRNRGTCDNGLVISRRELEERVLAGLKDKLLAPELVKEFIAEFHAELNRRGREAELAYEVARRERTEVERKITAMLNAIENGVFTASTRDRLLELERRKAELDGIKHPAQITRFHPNVAEVYRKRKPNHAFSTRR